jgi:hypothetical protein
MEIMDFKAGATSGEWPVNALKRAELGKQRALARATSTQQRLRVQGQGRQVVRSERFSWIHPSQTNWMALDGGIPGLGKTEGRHP